MLNKSVFTTQEAAAKGVSPRMLTYFLKKGHIRRVAQGVYTKDGAENDPSRETQFQLALKEVPQGVIGRVSALKYFGLLDEDPAMIELIVPTENIPKKKLEGITLFRAPIKSIKLGVEKKGPIRFTSIDRTLVECLRNGVSLKLVIQAFREAQSKGLRPSLSQMEKFARILRTLGRFKIFKEAIL